MVHRRRLFDPIGTDFTSGLVLSSFSVYELLGLCRANSVRLAAFKEPTARTPRAVLIQILLARFNGRRRHTPRCVDVAPLKVRQLNHLDKIQLLLLLYSVEVYPPVSTRYAGLRELVKTNITDGCW